VARRCVWSRNLENEEAKARYRAVKIQTQWVVTSGKQTTTRTVYKITYCRRYSVVTIYGARNVISRDKPFALLH